MNPFGLSLPADARAVLETPVFMNQAQALACQALIAASDRGRLTQAAYDGLVAYAAEETPRNPRKLVLIKEQMDEESSRVGELCVAFVLFLLRILSSAKQFASSVGNRVGGAVSVLKQSFVARFGWVRAGQAVSVLKQSFVARFGWVRVVHVIECCVYLWLAVLCVQTLHTGITRLAFPPASAEVPADLRAHFDSAREQMGSFTGTNRVALPTFTRVTRLAAPTPTLLTRLSEMHLDPFVAKLRAEQQERRAMLEAIQTMEEARLAAEREARAMVDNATAVGSFKMQESHAEFISVEFALLCVACVAGAAIGLTFGGYLVPSLVAAPAVVAPVAVAGAAVPVVVAGAVAGAAAPVVVAGAVAGAAAPVVAGAVVAAVPVAGALAAAA